MTEQSERVKRISEAVFTHRNTTFRWQDFVANPVNSQAAVLATCGHDDMSISDADLADLEAVRDNSGEPIRSLFERVLFIARVRQHNLLTVTDVAVVSMGCDCFSRTIPTRWGLKPTANLGERSGPFDLSVTTPEGVERLMVERFARLTDPSLLTYSNEHNIPLNVAMGTTFNHEIGADYAADNFARLRSTYQSRIATINETLEGDSPLLMVVHIPDFFGAQAEHHDLFHRIYATVAKGRSAPAAMVVINTFQPATPAASLPYAVTDITAGAVQWWNVALPWEGYVWHSVDHFMSAEGVAFEHDIAARLRQVSVSLRDAAVTLMATE